jgi:hypothetical protein
MGRLIPGRVIYDNNQNSILMGTITEEPTRQALMAEETLYRDNDMKSFDEESLNVQEFELP